MSERLREGCRNWSLSGISPSSSSTTMSSLCTFSREKPMRPHGAQPPGASAEVGGGREAHELPVPAHRLLEADGRVLRRLPQGVRHGAPRLRVLQLDGLDAPCGGRASG